MLRIARAALLAVLPAEVVFAVLIMSGVRPPALVGTLLEVAVAAVTGLVALVFLRLYRAQRRRGTGRRAAARAAVRVLVPLRIRRIMGFDAKGMVSLVLWVARRRHGVPPGTAAIPYSREPAPLLFGILFVMIVETVALEVLLRVLDAPVGLRAVVLAVDVYSVFIGIAVWAAYVTRPHVVSAAELRVRYGAFFDLRIPRHLISSVRRARRFDETGMVTVREGRLAVAVSSQTNVVVELTGEVPVTRPLGGREVATTVCFFADDPAAAVAALEPAEVPVEP